MSGEKTLNELFLDACEKGEEAKVNAAIVLGVDVNKKEAAKGATGLLWAIKHKHENIVDILLACPDIDINGKTNNGFFPLLVAAGFGLTSVVTKLGRMPALRGVNDQGYKGVTPLSWATSFGEDNHLLLEKEQFTSLGLNSVHQPYLLISYKLRQMEIISKIENDFQVT